MKHVEEKKVEKNNKGDESKKKPYVAFEELPNKIKKRIEKRKVKRQEL